jgi:hypothetical protein
VVGTWRKNALEAQEKEQRQKLGIRVTCKILEMVREVCLGSQQDLDRYKIRATLFRFNDDKLSIFARSGLHEESLTSWPIGKSGRESCRGVAGLAWLEQKTIYRKTLVPFPESPYAPETEIMVYAQAMEMSVDEASRINVKSNAILAVPVEVRGESWGFLWWTA